MRNPRWSWPALVAGLSRIYAVSGVHGSRLADGQLRRGPGARAARGAAPAAPGQPARAAISASAYTVIALRTGRHGVRVCPGARRTRGRRRFTKGWTAFAALRDQCSPRAARTLPPL